MANIKVRSIVKLIKPPKYTTDKDEKHLLPNLGLFFIISRVINNSIYQLEFPRSGKLLTFLSKHIVSFTKDCLKLERIEDYKKYKVGDSVRIRKLTKEQMTSLERCTCEGSFGSNTEMEKMGGKVGKISKITADDGYELVVPNNVFDYSWKSCWLIPKKIR